MADYFQISVSEQSYKDDWENGEIDGTFQECDMGENKTFSSPQEALKYFYDHYRGDLYGIYKIDEGDILKFGVCYEAYAGQYGFESASNEQKEAWKKGQITLYNVEYILIIKEVSYVKSMDLTNLGFKVEEN